MNGAALMRPFSYDPFDAAVMADPLPFYRTLRDEYPLYYVDQWDTYALSRFDDIWHVLEVNDGTFVASEGTLPSTAVLGTHNSGPVPDPPLSPMPFHANFDAPVYTDVRRCTSGPFRPRSVSRLADRIRELASERLTNCCRRDGSTSPRTTAEWSPPRWCANCWACPQNSPPTYSPP